MTVSLPLRTAVFLGTPELVRGLETILYIVGSVSLKLRDPFRGDEAIRTSVDEKPRVKCQEYRMKA
jgi:hypothetical protein